LLFGIDRVESRSALGIGEELPFLGVDIWNAWELTWLSLNGQPQIASCEIRIPAASPRIVESKSLKLYLNSFSMSPYASRSDIASTIENDLGACTESDVHVALGDGNPGGEVALQSFPGQCIDAGDVACDTWEVAPGYLQSDAQNTVGESLHSHLLRSLCPVTRQPDIGSVLVSYRGPRIERAGLLRYIVSYRKHSDFHEACVERMFLDLMAHCNCEELTVFARYQRRGGIDINPYRSTDNSPAANLRLWRQ
jgi:7-cyano-7-deazaguanine reductase